MAINAGENFRVKRQQGHVWHGRLWGAQGRKKHTIVNCCHSNINHRATGRADPANFWCRRLAKPCSGDIAMRCLGHVSMPVKFVAGGLNPRDNSILEGGFVPGL